MSVSGDRICLEAASIEPPRPVAREALHAALDQDRADPLRVHTDAGHARAQFDVVALAADVRARVVVVRS